MKKLIALLLAVVMVLGLAACATKTEAPATDTPTTDTPAAEAHTPAAESTAETVKIEMWVQGTTEEEANIPYAREVLDYYNKNHPEAPLEVDFVLGGDATAYMQKVLMAASTDTLPAIFRTAAANILGIPETGVLRDITDYVVGDEEWNSRMMPVSRELATSLYGERMYGVPVHAELSGWFMNKRLFEENGLEIPTTWEEWVHCIEVLKDAGVTPIAYGAADTWMRWGFDTFFERYGFFENLDGLLSGDVKYSDVFVPAYDKIDQLAKMGAFNSNVATATNTEACELFKAGQAAIITNGSWQLADFLTSPDAENFVFSWGPEFSDSESDQKIGVKMCSWTSWVGKKATEDEATLTAVLGYLKAFSDEEMVNLWVEKYNGFPAYEYTGDISKLPGLYQSLLDKNADEYTGVAEMAFYIDPTFEAAYWNSVSAVITQTATPEEAAQQLDDAVALVQ